MKVSLSRKIHIIALPQATWKAWRSDDQSATSPRSPGTGAEVSALRGAVARVVRLLMVIFQARPQMKRTTSGVSQPSAANSTTHTANRKCQ
ncbi:hypothetical protein FQZ97_1275630 [compost metagenome]